MSKLKKTITLFFLLILMCLCFSVVVSFQIYVPMPFYFISLEYYPLIGNWLPIVMFYIGVITCIILFISILIIIFYPKKISQFTLKKANGYLQISQKAIEGFVVQSLKSEKLIENPNVNATLSQKRIKIKVKGDFQIVSDLYGKTEQWSGYLENQLQELIGSDVKISIKVKFEKPRLQNNKRVN